MTEKEKKTISELLENLKGKLEPWKEEQFKRDQQNLTIDDNTTRTILFFTYLIDIIEEQQERILEDKGNIEELELKVEKLEKNAKKLKKVLRDNNIVWPTEY